MDRPIELTAESLWNEVAGRLKGALNETTYRTWFGDVASLELTEDEFVLRVPTDFAREWIEGHFIDLIHAAVRDATCACKTGACLNEVDKLLSAVPPLPREPPLARAAVAREEVIDPRAGSLAEFLDRRPAARPCRLQAAAGARRQGAREGRGRGLQDL